MLDYDLHPSRRPYGVIAYRILPFTCDGVGIELRDSSQIMKEQYLTRSA